MSELKKTAQAALEALQNGVRTINHLGGAIEAMPLHDAIATLRTALAAPQPCVGNDPLCPCQDGALCHYKDGSDGTKALAQEPQPEPVAVVPREFRAALRKLVFTARTSGGTAGPDSGLMAALDEAERVLALPYLNALPRQPVPLPEPKDDPWRVLGRFFKTWVSSSLHDSSGAEVDLEEPYEAFRVVHEQSTHPLHQPVQPEPVAHVQFLFVAMDDDKQAHLTWCLDEAAVRSAIKDAMFFSHDGAPLDADDEYQLTGVVEELLDSGAMTFEGDAPLYLYRVAGVTAPSEQAHPPRTPVPLTDERLCDIFREQADNLTLRAHWPALTKFARAVEAAVIAKMGGA